MAVQVLFLFTHMNEGCACVVWQELKLEHEIILSVWTSLCQSPLMCSISLFISHSAEVFNSVPWKASLDFENNVKLERQSSAFGPENVTLQCFMLQGHEHSCQFEVSDVCPRKLSCMWRHEFTISSVLRTAGSCTNNETRFSWCHVSACTLWAFDSIKDSVWLYLLCVRPVLEILVIPPLLFSSNR